MGSKRFEGIFTVEWEDHKEECHIREKTREKFLQRLNEARDEIFKNIPKDAHVKANYRGDFASGIADIIKREAQS